MDPLDYDVFISFAAEDQEMVRPLWRELTAAGFRVFWSDAALRNRAGNSWFDIIQEALSRSRHLLVVFTPAALLSKWVKREYVAFLSNLHEPPARLLVPLIGAGCTFRDLPLFLRELQACQLDDPSVIDRLISAFGGEAKLPPPPRQEPRRELPLLPRTSVDVERILGDVPQLTTEQRELAVQSLESIFATGDPARFTDSFYRLHGLVEQQLDQELATLTFENFAELATAAGVPQGKTIHKLTYGEKIRLLKVALRAGMPVRAAEALDALGDTVDVRNRYVHQRLEGVTGDTLVAAVRAYAAYLAKVLPEGHL